MVKDLIDFAALLGLFAALVYGLPVLASLLHV